MAIEGYVSLNVPFLCTTHSFCFRLLHLGPFSYICLLPLILVCYATGFNEIHEYCMQKQWSFCAYPRKQWMFLDKPDKMIVVETFLGYIFKILSISLSPRCMSFACIPKRTNYYTILALSMYRMTFPWKCMERHYSNTTEYAEHDTKITLNMRKPRL